MTMPDNQPSAAHAPAIRWNEDGLPESVAFNDIYFSKDNGLAETDYVFLQQNQLKQRFSTLRNNHCFVIGETGFGTGLNFLATWKLWAQTAPASACLHFISVEKYPLTQSQLLRALSLWPSLQPYYLLLLAQYRCIQNPGFHRLSFAGNNVHLTLIINDAQIALNQLFASDHPYYGRPQWQGIDAWFLDGFAPAKNPAMWSAELLMTIANLTKPQGTLATFTAAASVRQHLQTAGFTVEKVQGFGKKRHMIRATFNQSNSDHSNKRQHVPLTAGRYSAKQPLPWPVITNYQAAEKKQQIVVLGAGLAGCHTARTLADCDYKVTLIDRANTLAAGASGNAQGVVYAKLSPERHPLGEFNVLSLLYAQHYYHQFWSRGNGYGQQCGVLQLADNASIAKQHQQLAAMFSHTGLLKCISAKQASDLAGLPLNNDGLYFPNSGWLHAPAVCQSLIDHPSITVILATAVEAISRQASGWRLTGKCKAIENWEMSEIQTLVIANATDARALPLLQWLPTRAIRGQVTMIPTCAASRDLKTVICGQGYIAPAVENQHCIGASFNLHDPHTDIKQRDHVTNLHNIAKLLPLFEAAQIDCRDLNGRVSFRCATPDYLPMAGPVPDIDAFDRDYAQLRQDARITIHRSGTYLPGLYLNIGHGSRGFCYTPLCATLIASIISSEVPPLPQAIVQALNPARFIIRDLMRNRR
jgi:tRNA 5-methylaminomethyl-2-thiouridine biosynthesis bifunctional protein